MIRAEADAGAAQLAGSCIACLTGTDTGLALTGEPGFHLAALRLWGLQPDQDAAVVAGYVPGGVSTALYRVCGACAAKASMRPALAVHSGELPQYASRAARERGNDR